jgi:hypothetical protein
MEPVMRCFEEWKVTHSGVMTFANSPKHRIEVETTLRKREIRKTLQKHSQPELILENPITQNFCPIYQLD